MADTQDSQTNQQVLTVPVYGLTLGPIVKNEIAVGRVTFVSSSKLPRIRKRLGFPLPISKYKERMANSIFGNSDTYAVLKLRRSAGPKVTNVELSEIRSAFWMLASSFAFRDRSQSGMSLHQSAGQQRWRDVMVFNRESGGSSGTFYAPLERSDYCDGFWSMNAESGHFNNLLEIIDGQRTVDNKWKASICRAASLLGQSYLATSVAHAFSCNMIAIETLLCVRGDKFPKAIVDRILVLLGWIQNGDPSHWKDRVDRLYRLRCSYVHDGVDNIEGWDVHESGVILQNLLTNLCRNTSAVKNKQRIVRMAEELAAYETLGKQPPKQKMHLTYEFPLETSELRKKMNDTLSWEW